jgi:predicted nucleotidyltransferase
MTYLASILQELKQLKPELSERFFVSDIGLFGSVTRDDFTDKSDIDIIVDFKKPVGIEFIDLADFLENNFKRKVDLVSKNGIKANFYSRIKDEIQYV